MRIIIEKDYESMSKRAAEFVAEVVLPQFNGGTSAIVVAAEAELGQSEIKHLVHR